jgi:hypothetical protein
MADVYALRFHWMTRSLVWIQSARGDGHEEVAADAWETWTGPVEAEHRHERIPLSREDIPSQQSLTLHATSMAT